MILNYIKTNNLNKLHEELLQLHFLQPVQNGEFMVPVFSLQGDGDAIKIICKDDVEIHAINEVVANHIAE
jgi:hypothetical protein